MPRAIRAPFASLAACLLAFAFALACVGGEGEPVAPVPAPAPPQAPAPRAEIAPVLTGDPVLDAFQLDCAASISPGDPGADECASLPPLPVVEGANRDCESNAEICRSGCAMNCTSCQQQCASDCSLCRNACEDADCIKFCAEARASCRLVCMRAQSECGRTCGEDIAQCTASAADQLARDCPRCDKIRQCLADRDRAGLCRERYAGEDERCFTWCQ